MNCFICWYFITFFVSLKIRNPVTGLWMHYEMFYFYLITFYLSLKRTAVRSCKLEVEPGWTWTIHLTGSMTGPVLKTMVSINRRIWIKKTTLHGHVVCVVHMPFNFIKASGPTEALGIFLTFQTQGHQISNVLRISYSLAFTMISNLSIMCCFLT